MRQLVVELLLSQDPCRYFWGIQFILGVDFHKPFSAKLPVPVTSHPNQSKYPNQVVPVPVSSGRFNLFSHHLLDTRMIL